MPAHSQVQTNSKNQLCYITIVPRKEKFKEPVREPWGLLVHGSEEAFIGSFKIFKEPPNTVLDLSL
jgi:hypothetical protein